MLDTAVQLTSVEGLNGLSLGRLANELGVSKSGLFTHWPSKEHLQLAVVDRAKDIWLDRVVRPALRAPRGTRRLWALHEARLAYLTEEVDSGGCFFAAIQQEFGAQPGAVRDRLIELATAWGRFLYTLTTDAVTRGELRRDTDPELLAYEIEALGAASAAQSRLLEPDATFARARMAVLRRLRELSVDPALLPLR
ncbi:TetR/AcrR family transcriptional regulator [Amycolatopsis sp. NPDC049868]|uniref:TetR/AcrR family transcriptional regulator n=1 Tax=Amycolatopsis sp. NPDC049868 TaxID=3363934 RepID=UPI00379066CC